MGISPARDAGEVTVNSTLHSRLPWTYLIDLAAEAAFAMCLREPLHIVSCPRLSKVRAALVVNHISITADGVTLS